MYYIGIDGGKNYTRLVAAEKSETGEIKVIGRHVGNSSDLGSYTEEDVLENIRRLMTEFNMLTNTKIADCISVCIGTESAQYREKAHSMEKILRQVGFVNKVLVVNDAQLILAAETKGDEGIVIISGVNSIGWAIDKFGKLTKSGGWGYLVNDLGSGFSIGMEAIKCALEEFDGRGKKTELTDKIKEHFGIKQIDEVEKFLYSDSFNKSKIAQLSLMVKYSAEEKDELAMQIQDKAALALVKTAQSLIEKKSMHESKIIICGNNFLLNDSLKDKFTREIHKLYKKAVVVTPKEKPEMGGIYLGNR